MAGECLAGSVDLFFSPALLLVFQQLFGHQAVVAYQPGQHVLLTLGFIDTLDLGQHHGFGRVECFFRLLHGLDLQIKVGEVLICLWFPDQLVVEEIAQRRLEHLEVVSHVDLPADLNGHCRQCLDRISNDHRRSLGRIVIAEVTVELRPAGTDAVEPPRIGTDLNPCEVVGRAIRYDENHT